MKKIIETKVWQMDFTGCIDQIIKKLTDLKNNPNHIDVRFEDYGNVDMYIKRYETDEECQARELRDSEKRRKSLEKKRKQFEKLKTELGMFDETTKD